MASIVTDVKEPAVVPIDFQLEGRRGTITVGDRMENRFAPIKNPVTGDEETVRVCIPGGLEYSRGDGVAEILTSQTLRLDGRDRLRPSWRSHLAGRASGLWQRPLTAP